MFKATLTKLAVGAVAVTSVAAFAGSGSGASAAVRSASSKEITIGFSDSNLGVAFDIATLQAIDSEAKALHVKVLFDNANGSAATQATQMQTLLLQHVKGIIVDPADSAAIVPSITLANKANVPIVGVAVSPASGKVYTVVTANTYQAGYDQGVIAVTLLKQRYGTAKGNVVFGLGVPALNVSVNEYNGVKAALKKYPNIHLVATFTGDYTESVAYTAMLAVLAAHPDTAQGNGIDVAIGADDNTSAGIVQAIAKAGRSEPLGSPKRILIVSATAQPSGVAALKNHEFSADIELNPLTAGQLAVENLVNAIHGKKSPGPVVDTADPIVTLKNLYTVKPWGLTYKN